MPGTLHVVATPLGNLEDLAPRARQALAQAALIACEDTRRTAKLLARFSIAAPMVALNAFTEHDRMGGVLAVLARGDDVALVSDGGTPAISDPGSLLVAAAHDAGYRVSPVPGPSAAIAILSASGFPADRFVFEGFLPPRAGERRNRLRELAEETRTIVVYEAPHRAQAFLADLAAIFGTRTIVLGRELTKIHETVVRGTAAEVSAQLGAGDVRGEIAVAIAGYDRDRAEVVVDDDRLAIAWAEELKAAGGSTRDALKAVAKRLSLKKPEVWRRLAERGLVRD